MEHTKDIILSLTPSGHIPVVRVKQGDSSLRYIRITVIKDHEVVIPGAEQTILFREEKPDGHGVILDNTYPDTELGRLLVTTDESGAITVELVSETTTCHGFCKCDLCFVNGGAAISTAPFLIFVEPSPDIISTAVSSDDFRTLINALEDVGLSSTTQLSDMTDVVLNSVQDGQLVAYDATLHKWTNKDIEDYGYQTEQNVRSIVTEYGYQTATQVNTLIAEAIAALDGNDLEY